MNPGTQGIALWLALIFVALFVALLFVVTRAFRARGWHEWGTAARPIRIRSRAASRLVGALVALVGCGLAMGSWADAHSQRFFSFKLATLGPTAIGIGAWMLIEGPVMPPKSENYPPPSLLGWVMMISGFAIGLAYSEFLKTGRLPFLAP
jgi:formate hydrogenlyase subunit 3/multisubunit Na+/H+ antiporter MnhD subunit